MPSDVAMIVSGVVLMFVLFAGALMWASSYTRDVKTPGASYFDKAK